MRQLYKKELARMRTSPRARQTKSVERQGKFYNLEAEYKDTRKKAKMRAKTLELTAAEASRMGGKIKGRKCRYRRSQRRREIHFDSYDYGAR